MVGSQCGFVDHAGEGLARALQRQDVFEGEVGHYFVEELERELEKRPGHLSSRSLVVDRRVGGMGVYAAPRSLFKTKGLRLPITNKIPSASRSMRVMRKHSFEVHSHHRRRQPRPMKDRVKKSD